MTCSPNKIGSAEMQTDVSGESGASHMIFNMVRPFHLQIHGLVPPRQVFGGSCRYGGITGINSYIRSSKKKLLGELRDFSFFISLHV